MCEIDLGDVCEVYIPTRPLAKKPHKCEGCGAWIPAGKHYYRTFMIFEGDPSTTKHCAGCERDLQAFAKAHDNQVPHPAALTDVLQECIDEGMPNEERRWKAMLTRIRGRSSEPEATAP